MSNIIKNLRLTLAEYLISLALRVIPKDTKEAVFLAYYLAQYIKSIK